VWSLVCALHAPVLAPFAAVASWLCTALRALLLHEAGGHSRCSLGCTCPRQVLCLWCWVLGEVQVVLVLVLVLVLYLGTAPCRC
jgi:hypothetical protein